MCVDLSSGLFLFFFQQIETKLQTLTITKPYPFVIGTHNIMAGAQIAILSGVARTRPKPISYATSLQFYILCYDVMMYI